MTTRRELMQWTAASFGVIASDLARATEDDLPKPLNILFLGGTGFLGPVQVEYALARGHRVTLFNRGRSAAGLFGDRAELLIGNRDAKIDQGLTALQGDRRWDVVIDNSGYLPLVSPGRPSRHFANRASQDAGLYYRPLTETAAATLDWWLAQSEARVAKVEGWPSPEKEREALAQLTAARG